MPATRAVGLRALILSILVFLMAAPLFAGGQREDRLRRVDRLIEQRYYNEALKLLTDIMIDQPDLWDRAQERMDELYAILDQKSALEDRIYDALVSDDVDRAYGLLQELQKLDPSPNKDAEQLFSEIVFNIGIIRNEKLLDEIMARARVALDDGRIDDALETYLTGFDVGVSVFESTDYGDQLIDVVSLVRSSVGRVVDAVRRFETDRVRFSDLVAEKNTLLADLGIADDPAPVRDNLNNLLPVALAIDSGQSSITRINGDLQRLRRDLRDRLSTIDDVYYLAYVDTLIKGRSGNRGSEGVLAAMDVGLDAEADRYLAEIRALADSTFAAAVDAYGKGDYENATRLFAAVRPRSALMFDAAGLAAFRVKVDRGLDLDRGAVEFAGRELSRVAGAVARSAAASAYRDATAVLVDARTITQPPDSAARGELEATRRTIISAVRKLSEAESTTAHMAERFVEGMGRYASEDERRLFAPILADLGSEVARLGTTETKIVGRIIELRVADLRSRFDPVETSRMARAEALIAGEKAQTGAGFGESVDVRRYPTRAKALLDVAAQNLDLLAADLSEMVDSYADEPAYIRDSEPVVLAFGLADRLQSDIDDSSRRAAEIGARAGELIAQADDLRARTRTIIETGEALLSEADGYFDQETYDKATQSILPAVVETGVGALTVEWDDPFRKEVALWIEKFADLSADARLAALQRETDARLAEARAEYLTVRDDMQSDDLERALGALDPVRSAMEDAQSFRDDAEFVARIEDAVGTLVEQIRNARADTLRGEAVDRLVSAERYLAENAGDLTEERYRGALERIPPVEEKLAEAESFLPDPEFASEIDRRIEALRDGLVAARAALLRRKVDEVLVEAERYLSANAEEMTEELYRGALERIPPVEEKLAEAESFLPDPEFASEIDRRIEAFRDGIVAARAALLRKKVDEVLAEAERYLSENAANMDQAVFETRDEYLTPVRDALARAESFASDPAFRARIEAQLSAVAEGFAGARSTYLQRLAAERFAAAQAYFDSVGVNVEEVEYNRALELLDPVRVARDEAEAFREDEAFRTEIDRKIATLESAIHAARADQLRKNALAFLDRASESADAGIAAADKNRTDQAADEFRAAREFLRQVASLTGAADEVSPDREFSKRIDARIIDMQKLISDTEIAIVVRDVRRLINDTQSSYSAGDY